MLFRLVVIAALLLAGGPVADAARGIPPAPPRADRTASSVPRASAAVSTPPPTTAGADTTVTELDVVVPPVSASGDVVETPAVRAGLADADTIVTDSVVAGDRVESAVVEVATTDMLGVTWPDGGDAADLGAQVRTRTDGTWSDWATLAAADDAPDAGTADARRDVRGGTDPLWVGGADAVQLSFAATDSGGPEDLRLALVGEAGATTVAPQDAVTVTRSANKAGSAVFRAAAVTRSARATSSSSPVTATANLVRSSLGVARATGREAGLLAAVASAPRVISRAEWGARSAVCTPDVASGLVGVVVHHTADNKSYSTVAEAMTMIQADQAYHIDGRGWCDIGYNFVVDKWGNIYEGRANSLTQPVIGVHAGGFNTGTVGISMLGNYDTTATPRAMIDAVGLIAGWRLAGYGVDPQGRINYLTFGGENSKIPAGTTINLPSIFAHRDVAYTACPGRYGYAQMDNIRAVAAQGYGQQLFAESQSVVRALYQDLLGRGPDPTGLAGWSAALVSGTSQSELVGALTRSDEYISLRVAKAYNEVLGRGPDPQGAADWLEQIRQGYGTVDDVQRRFYDSNEYFLTSGGTDAGYIKRLFTTMLRRTASDGDVAFWVGVQAQYGRSAMVDALWFWPDAAAVRAGDYYQTFLGRGPDPEGQAAWAQVLLTYGEGTVRTGIAGSLEYRARAIIRYP